MDANQKFKIGEFKKGSEVKRIYLLNPGDCFQGFGGSKSGLVAKKTASLIVRESGPYGTEDVEYDINKANVWKSIFNVVSNWAEVEQ